ncbi:MAG: hypothetical protein Fur0018_13760 [Anaerolineales bacterium]
MKKLAFLAMLLALALAACSPGPAAHAVETATAQAEASAKATADAQAAAQAAATGGSKGGIVVGKGECEVAAVDLIGAWVDAGASDTAAFTFTAADGSTCQGAFADEILPFFTQPGMWFPNSPSCNSCHNGNTDTSLHEMDLNTYEGIMKGADVLSSPPGVPIIVPGDWHASKLRDRLRNNRMPPGYPFDITESNRNGPCVEVSADGVSVVKDENGKPKYGCDLNAVDLIGAWVDAGASDTEAFEYGGAQLTFARDILPFFTQSGMWFENSSTCNSCHNGNTDTSLHEMDLNTYAGIMKGADVLSAPPGAPIIVPGDWHASKLRDRLRNNRMPPGMPFDITESNRNGPTVMAGAKK